MNKVREAIEFDKESDSHVILQYEGIIFDTESVDIMYDVYEGLRTSRVRNFINTIMDTQKILIITDEKEYQIFKLKYDVDNNGLLIDSIAPTLDAEMKDKLEIMVEEPKMFVSQWTISDVEGTENNATAQLVYYCFN